jgi:norsolorinic acid ketoreductase
MVPDHNPTYLVTGASRGIGREIVKQLSTIPDAKIIAGVRSLDTPQTKSLRADYPKAVIVKIDSEVDNDPSEAAKKLVHMGIKKVDTIFANAGIMLDSDDALDVKADNLRKLFNVNAIAPLLLFQAFKPLLEASSAPKFVFFSTLVASIGSQSQIPFKTTSYGATKAALNFFMVRLALENSHITTFSIHPGVVATDMAAFAVEAVGKTLDDVLSSGMGITTEQSVKAIIKTAKGASLEQTSGKFVDVTTGAAIPW